MIAARPGVITDWDLMERQVQFYRDHLDIFIEDAFPPAMLTMTQHVSVRMIGNGDDIKIVCSRGYGKTLQAAYAAFGIACLYPGTDIGICSGTAAQATLVLVKIKQLVDSNPNMANELVANGARSLVQISKDKGKCVFKNGSTIESYTLESMRGLRKKVIIVDEALEMDQDQLNAIVEPIKNHRRYNARTYKFQDFSSKSIYITSACEKNNSFYDDFKRVLREMAKGNNKAFACALDWRAAVADGITDEEFFEKERARMPASVFQMEYGSIFLGATNNSAFPYELTQPCRTLQRVEICQPKNCKSRYVISLDIATSDAAGADNSIISVIKFTQKTDGSYSKKLVKMQSFHGKGLDVLANEIRQIFHIKFPNAERIIYDARGLGDSFSKFLDEPWIDPTTGKEYPPLVHDDEFSTIANALPVLHAVRAVQTINQRMATSLRVMLEKRTIELPMNSRILENRMAQAEKPIPMTIQEIGTFKEVDALQFEMGNIVAKVSAAGNYIYDTPRASMHKDRYSSLAYGCDYIVQLEQESIKRHKRGPVCIGFATHF